MGDTQHNKSLPMGMNIEDTGQVSGVNQPPDSVAGLEQEFENVGVCEAWTMGDDLARKCVHDPYETPNPTDDQGTCIVCKRRPTSRKCASCGNDWICYKSCEEYMDLNESNADAGMHRIACQNRPKKTADILLAAIALDELPTDYHAEDDCGLSRCRNTRDPCQLFTLYHDLVVNMYVTPFELDVWMKENKLYKRIGAKIAARPEAIDRSARSCSAKNGAIFDKPTYGDDDNGLWK
ncbi:hypothetical protein LZ31DRAFT_608015 [Colletotrichum somersetense]|nr:hypothetical protein LZ31DRAFT_608015 [Colletotrichum somersetense]